MSEMKSLAKDTAIYGLSSIIGKFLNYLLVPLYTYALARTSDYGVVTNIYAWTALLLVLLTYGMETGFFRFVNREDYDAKSVYKTAFFTLLSSSTFFAVLVIVFQQPIANVLGYADHSEFIAMMFATVAIDAFASIPFAYLRYQKRPIRFAILKLLFVLLNIGFNLLFLVALGKNDVFYVFLSNILATTIQTLCLLPMTMPKGGHFDAQVLKEMLRYSLPLLILGVAGIMNQTLDRILFPYLYTGADAQAQLGIYGACFKVAMVMMMFTQAFRYAYEPFVFGKSKEEDNRETYARAMKYYLIFTLLAFLVVMGYIDLLRYLVGESYWEGLRVVPIVMAAEIMFGVFFNLSFWYKLTDRTIWGAYFSGIGAVILIVMIILLIPKYSYMACAWAGFVAYGSSMVLSYVIGQHYYPVNYPLRSMGLYTLLAAVLYGGIMLSNSNLPPVAAMSVNTMLIIFYVAIVVKRDLPLKSLPFVGRFIK